MKFFFSRNLLGQVKLPTDFVAGIVKRNAMTALSGNCRKRQPSRTGTDDCELFYPRRRSLIKQSFVSGMRIDQAANRSSHKRVIKASLVTTNAGINIIFASIPSLVGEVKVSQ